MIELFITISTFSSMVLLFKYFEIIRVNNLQAITANYFTAGILSILNLSFNIKLSDIFISLRPLFLGLSLIIGLLFVITFNFYAKASQNIGITASTIANKMSMIIPIIIGFLFLNEDLTTNKFIGISLAIGAIFLSSLGNGKTKLKKNHLILLSLLFLGQGIADAILNWSQNFIINYQNMNLFFGTIFMSAGFSGLFLIFFKLKNKKMKIKFRNISWGIALGIPNYITLLYFIKSLKSKLFSSSEIFPIINIGVIVVCTLLSIILFKERVTTHNWLGLGLGIFSIYLILG